MKATLLKSSLAVCAILSCSFSAFSQSYPNKVEISSDGTKILIYTSEIDKLPIDIVNVSGQGLKAVSERYKSDITSKDNRIRDVSCVLSVDLPVGHVGGNVSHGAYCIASDYTSNYDLIVCDDDMLGYFRYERFERTLHIRDSVAKFAAAYCFGG